MSVIETVWRELNHADEQMRSIIHIRITTDAIPNSPISLPVSPERARTLGKLWAFPDGVEVAYDGRALELLMHPEDWVALLKDMDAARNHLVQLGLRPGEPDRVWGIPVSRMGGKVGGK